jgi:glucose-6-phosphate isomerase
MEIELESLKLRFEDNKKQVRRLGDMGDFFSDQDAVAARLDENPLIYEVYAHENEGQGNLSYAVTVIKPGDIGGEYFMTKGHFHEKDVAEVYIGLEGEGLLLLQDKEGNTRKLPLEPGRVSYVPKGYAHRSINTGNSELRLLAIYASDSGHDYGTIKEEGFKEKIVKN